MITAASDDVERQKKSYTCQKSQKYQPSTDTLPLLRPPEEDGAWQSTAQPQNQISAARARAVFLSNTHTFITNMDRIINH